MVNIPDSVEGSLVTKLRIEPERSAVRLALTDGGPFGSFIEISMKDDGMLIGPVEAGTMLELWDRKAGHAPKDWLVETELVTAVSGLTEYAVYATDVLSNKVYQVVKKSGATISDRPPAMWLSSTKEAFILSYGEAHADLHHLSLISGSSKKVRSWNWDSSEGEAFFEPSKRLFFVPKESGYDIYDLSAESTAGPLANLILTGLSEYAFVLPNSIYAGSPGCERLLRLDAGDGKLDGSSIAVWRNRPADVLKALGGDPAQIEILAKVTERWHKRLGFDSTKPAPKASDLPKISVPERPPLWSKEQEVEFPVEWRSSTLPVRRVIVRVNGVESSVFEDETLPKKNHVNVKAKLAEGQNWIEVVVEDEKGRSSDLVRFRTILSEVEKPTKRFIIAMGVSKYRDSALNLEFAAKDATDLASAIKESAKGETEVLLLTDEHATKEATAKIRDFLANATENDEVVAFCAGHGVLDSNLDYVYASHEFDSANPSETGIKLDELVDAIGSSKSLKRLLLLDTCHSGQVGEKDEMLLAQMNTELPKGVRAVKQRGMSVKPIAGLSAEGQQRFIEEMFLLPGLHRGINIIGASGGAEFALESAQWNNGVFTATIIEALRDKKADLNGDARISVGELRDFLGQRVSELTKGAQKPSVVAAERDQDFDLIRVAYKRPMHSGGQATLREESAETSEILTPTIPKSDSKIWLFADSSERLLTNQELASLSPGDLWRARNELFARRGFIFKSDKGKALVASLGASYSPESSDQDVILAKMNPTEKANLKAIKQFEKQ